MILIIYLSKHKRLFSKIKRISIVLSTASDGDVSPQREWISCFYKVCRGFYIRVRGSNLGKAIKRFLGSLLTGDGWGRMCSHSLQVLRHKTCN